MPELVNPLEGQPPEAAEEAPLEQNISDRPTKIGGQPSPAPMESIVDLSVFPFLVAPSGREPVVPGYKILGILGRGGMGVVYKAQHLRLKRLVALKMILAGSHAGLEQVRRFSLEAEAAARLQHPNIVQIYEIGEWQPDGANLPLPFFAMELVEGGNLAQRLARMPFPARRAAQLTETLARAMHYAHQRGIIHRDLKPANILIADCGLRIADSPSTPRGDRARPPDFTDQSAIRNPQSAIKITDFGLAKHLGEEGLTQTGAMIGTPGYMAPELALGQDGVERAAPAVDIYALGAILYEMLVGRPPFRGQTVPDILEQARHQEPVPPRRLEPRLPRDLETICLKCLEKDPANRYANAEALADDLRRFLNDEPVQARMSGRLERAWRWCRRKPSWAASVASAILLPLAAVVAGFWYQQDRLDRKAEQARHLGDLARIQAQQETEAARREAEDARKAVQLEREVKSALQEATTLRERAWTLTAEPHQWEATLAAALSAARRGEALAASNDGLLDPDLRVQVQTLTAQVLADEKERQLVADLERIRLKEGDIGVQGVHPHPRDLAAKYRATFRDAGLTPTATTPEQAAAWMAQRREPVLTAVVAALDSWYFLPGMQSQERRWIEQVLKAADKDDLRRQVRTAIATQNRKALETLAERADVVLQPAATLILLATALREVEADPSAIRLLQRAQTRYPAEFWINYELSDALTHAEPPRWGEATSFLRVALALRPKNARVYNNLGCALHAQDDASGAAAALSKAIELEPKYAAAHNNLGTIWATQEDWPRALAAFKKAIELDPNNAHAHYNLGNALSAQKDLRGAIAAYQKAVELDPDLDGAYNNLGIALQHQGHFPDAVAAYRKSLAIDPRKSAVHYNLANCLAALHDLPGAVSQHHQAIAVRADYPEAHCNLGHVLGQMGQFSESLAFLKRGHELGSQQKSWPYPSEQWVREAERLVRLESRLPAVLRGDEKPSSPAEHLDYAHLCRCQGSYGASTRFYQQAFADSPTLGTGLTRFQAACAAALAGCGQGQEEAPLDDKTRAEFRKQALAWFRADLALWERQVETGPPEARAAARRTLPVRKYSLLLACIRDEKELAQLPEAERRQWQQFWADFETLLTKVQAG